MLSIIIAAKVGIKSCRFATECISFVHVWMQLANQLVLCSLEQTKIVASAACRVGRQEFHSWIASLPLVSLLFTIISLCMCHTHFYNGGASFLYCSTAFKKALALP